MEIILHEGEIPDGLMEYFEEVNEGCKKDVFNVATQPFKGAHFAVFPEKLIEPCVLAGCPTGGTILDPFGGSGTTAVVANKHNRDAILIELNPEFADMAAERLNKVQVALEFTE